MADYEEFCTFANVIETIMLLFIRLVVNRLR